MKGLTPNNHIGRAETVVYPRLASDAVRERPSRRAGVTLDRDVDVQWVAAQEQVAHSATHQVGGRKALESAQEPLHPG